MVLIKFLQATVREASQNKTNLRNALYFLRIPVTSTLPTDQENSRYMFEPFRKSQTLLEERAL